MKIIEDVTIIGSVADAANPDVRLNFKSTRARLSSRAEKVISDILSLVRMAEQGRDYKNATIYFKRYQPFIDAGTKDFQVRSMSTYQVTA